MSIPVKTSKPGVRAEKTAQTRRRMIEAAYLSFAERGYDSTKMTDIAKRAGVAHQTLYFTFGTKKQLLQEAFVFAVMGERGRPPEQQPWFEALQNAADAREAMAAIVSGAVDIFERVRPLVAAARATADSDAASVWQRQQTMRRAAYRHLLEIACRHAPLRPTLDVDRAVDTMLVLLGPDVYQLHVADNGWTAEEYTDWATDALCRLLLR